MDRFECPSFDTRYCMLTKLGRFLGVLPKPERKSKKLDKSERSSSAPSDAEVQTTISGVRGASTIVP